MRIETSALTTRGKDKIKIILPIPVYHKMLAYAQASPGEISGFGRTRITHRKGITIVTVTDVRIFKQEVGDGDTTLTTDVLSKFIVELDRIGEKIERWNVWWHSHNDFNVFFSSIDDRAIEGIIAKKTSDNFFYSICINKAADLVARADSRRKIIKDVPVVVDRFINKRIQAACEKEVAEKVTYKKVATTVFPPSVFAPTVFMPKPFTPTNDSVHRDAAPGPDDWYLHGDF